MYEQKLSEAIGALRMGVPISDGPLSILPLKSTARVGARYVLLGEAIHRGRLRITEVDEAGSVPHLVAVNKGPWPVLIFDGEELVGAKQNRIANATILVGVGTSVLPVSCVEQGRWSRKSHSFSAGSYASHPRLRSLKERQVRGAVFAARADEPRRAGADLRTHGSPAGASQQTRAARFRSDQGAVWDEVRMAVEASCAEAPTLAMADGYEAGKDEMDRLFEAFGPDSLPVGDAVATMVFYAGEFVCLDLLQPAKRFGRLYPKLLRGYAFEALMRGKWEAGRKGVPADFDPEAAALRLLAEIKTAQIEEQAGPDLGEDLRLETKGFSGAGLMWEGELIQLSVFPRN